MDKVGNDDRGREAWRRLKSVEVRVPGALSHAVDAVGEISWIAVVAEPPSIRTSTSVSRQAKTQIGQCDSDEHTPKSDCHAETPLLLAAPR